MTARISRWPGIELRAADLLEGKVTQTRFRPDAKYAWSAGEAMSRFLQELQNGRFIARTCHKCERILFPPRMFCEECFRPTDEWTFIQDTGTIETFSVSYLDTDAKRIGEPILVGLRDEGRMLASRCAACKLDYLPPRMFCEDCFAELTEYVDVPRAGQVAAVTVAHVDRTDAKLSQPQVWAFVTFEGIRGG